MNVSTKHGYTEKPCKVCGKVKKRDEFPAFGGKTCRVCLNAKNRDNQTNKWKAIKEDPKKLEKHNERSREGMRRLRGRKKKED